MLQASPFHLFPACSELVQRNLVITFLNKLARNNLVRNYIFCPQNVSMLESPGHAQALRKWPSLWSQFLLHKAKNRYQPCFCLTGCRPSRCWRNRQSADGSCSLNICWQECEASGKYKRNKYQTNLQVCHSSHACPWSSVIYWFRFSLECEQTKMIANHAVGNILANSTVRKKRMRNCQCLGCFFQLKCVCVHSTAAVFTLPVIWIPRRKWCFCRTVIWKCLCGQTHQKRPWFQPKKLNSINYHFSGTKYKSQARCTFTWTWNIFFWIGTMCIINANKGLHRLLHQLLWHGRSVLQPLQFPEFHGCLASQNMICNCVYTCWLKKCAFHVFMYPCMYACMYVYMYAAAQ